MDLNIYIQHPLIMEIAIFLSSIQGNIEFCTFYIYRKLLHENWEYVAFIPTIKFDKYT